MKAHDMNTESAANDLTQLSSREQLSALMDGALPPDQTRFLLRRLQHDAPLAESWERWRLAGETMRGLAPAQRLPADFALRVGAALRGEDAPAMRSGGKRMPTWLRWGGGAAMATCSVLPEENEAVTDDFLQAHPEFEMTPFALPLPIGRCGGRLTLWPQRNGTDGFYICRMRRKD